MDDENGHTSYNTPNIVLKRCEVISRLRETCHGLSVDGMSQSPRVSRVTTQQKSVHVQIQTLKHALKYFRTTGNKPYRLSRKGMGLQAVKAATQMSRKQLCRMWNK
uniref:Uncharacterized protein n=1 Tax=Magallana gigas TaxID=29159 RepID=K1Q4Q9_MAGGI